MNIATNDNGITKDAKTQTEISDLEIKFLNCFNEDVVINKSGRYELKLNNDLNFDEFSFFISSCKRISVKNETDICLNDFSIKNDKMVKKYLQQNCLILSNKSFINDNLSVNENIRIVSLLFTGYDLSNACVSSFGMQNIANNKVKILTDAQKNMMILSYTVCCPSIIWIINKSLLSCLFENELGFFENAVKIRVKHGGIVLLIED